MVNKKKLKQQSIHDYLGLGHRIWFLEFEVGDFGASIANLFELPLEVYKMRAKTFFWAFLQVFLQKVEISFILRQSIQKDSSFDRIDLALLGYWENNQFAIPLWIMKDLLLGFEVIPAEHFVILDSEPLTWSRPISITNKHIDSSRKEEFDIIILSDDFFQGQKIYFRLEGGHIVISQYLNELEFFDRIARTNIPEIDEPDEKYI